jgi:hypothetical protein
VSNYGAALLNALHHALQWLAKHRASAHDPGSDFVFPCVRASRSALFSP